MNMNKINVVFILLTMCISLDAMERNGFDSKVVQSLLPTAEQIEQGVKILAKLKKSKPTANNSEDLSVVPEGVQETVAHITNSLPSRDDFFHIINSGVGILSDVGTKVCETMEDPVKQKRRDAYHFLSDDTGSEQEHKAATKI